MKTSHAAAWAATLACSAVSAQVAPAQPASAPDATAGRPEQTLPAVTIRASADASAQGLSPAYPGGQVARGGRAGILGTRDNMETPFSITSYTNELIQDRQARSVGDVLQNDAGVRTARGFGNFQESYFIRGFLLSSDDVAYNGLYSLLPRQYIATELFERVEVLHGASAFLSGANPGGGGIGGAINLLPKRAPNQDLTRGTLSDGSGSQLGISADVARRFGPDGSTGVRFNAATRSGGTGVDDEHARLDLLALGLDWHSRDVRLSGDIGWQNNRLRQTRTNVSLSGVTEVPRAPDASSNFAQPWSYSNERDLFGTLRGEWDLSTNVTAWAAYGLRRSDEANSLANLDVSNAQTGAASTYRFDNTRKDHVDTGELGLRGKLRTGPVGHEWVASASAFRLDKKNAYGFDFANQLATNLYTPTSYAQPAFGPNAGFGGDLAEPRRTGVTRLTSYAAADTLSMLDDRLLVTLGLRHQKLDIANYAYGSAVLVDPDYEKSRTSPVAGVVYKLGRQISLYANYIEGLTQGDTASSGFGQPPVDNQGQTLAPYVSKQKEIGAKFDAGSVGGGIALFSTTRPRSVIVNNVFTSSGEDRHQGAELNVFGRPVAGVRLLGGLTWLDAEQRSTGGPATDGKRVIGVPRTQANAGAELDVPGVQGLAVDARVVYTGARYADDLNTLRVPSWTRLDLGARYLTDVQGRLVTLRARVDNVGDRSYWSSVGGYSGAGYLVVGAPRTFSLSASVDY